MDIRVCFMCHCTFNTNEKTECCGMSVLHPISVLKNVIVNVTIKMKEVKNNNTNSVLIARVVKRKRVYRTKKGKITKVKSSKILKLKEMKKEKKKRKAKNIDQWIKDKVAIRDGGRCVVCKSKEGLHLHHIIHRKNGGTDDPDNLKTLCELCHAEEHRDEPIYTLMIQRLFKYKAI